MPELVEVETFRSQLEEILIGESINSVEVYHLRSIRRHGSIKEFTNLLVGKKIVEISRFGKYLTLQLSDPSVILSEGACPERAERVEWEGSKMYLNIHLRMSGRFLLNNDPTEDPKHSHIIINTDKFRLLFIDPRTFGEMWVTSETTPEISRGIDALLASNVELQKVLMKLSVKSSKSIKTILLDQQYISGIGNIYADEICAHAGINVARRICDLKDKEIYQLVRSTKIVLKKAIKLRGSSLRDESFRDLHGHIGRFQKFHQVHARAGQPCYVCGSEIVRTKIAGRSSYFCPLCQT